MNTHQELEPYTPGQHVVRGIPFKAHKIIGFTPEMLEHHYEQVYGGAVRRLNEIEKRIEGELGIDARSLSGGVTAWRAMGYSSASYID